MALESMLDASRIDVITQCIRDGADFAGDLAELGVCNGGTAFAMHQAAPHRVMHLFDTFTGLPPTSAADGTYLREGMFGVVEGTLMQLVKLPVEIYQGVFPYTVPREGMPPILVAHVDFDLYEPTVAALDVLWPVLVPGGAIIFDDLSNAMTPGIRRALDEAYIAYEEWGFQAVMRKQRVAS